MEQWGNAASTAVNLAAMIMAVGAFRVYFPRFAKPWSGGGDQWLVYGFFLLAVGVSINSSFWGPVNQVLASIGVPVQVIRAWYAGDLVDVFAKGLMCVGFWCGLKAVHVTLPREERRKYWVIELPLYPARMWFLRLGVFNQGDDRPER